MYDVPLTSELSRIFTNKLVSIELILYTRGWLLVLISVGFFLGHISVNILNPSTTVVVAKGMGGPCED